MTAPAPIVCPGCGARPKGPADRFCAYCGVALPVPVTDAERRRDERASRFAALRRHPDAQRAADHRPSAALPLVGGLAGTGFLVVFVLVTLVIGGFGATMAGGFGFVTTSSPFGGLLALPFVLVPLLMAGFGIYAAVQSARRTQRIAAAPLECIAALVRDERAAVSGRDGHRTNTAYFLTLEAEDGAREEYEALPRIVGRVSVDDIGFAYVRGGVLLDFRRVDV